MYELAHTSVYKRAGVHKIETTTQLIKISVFTHASRVNKFSTVIVKMKVEKLQVSPCTAT